MLHVFRRGNDYYGNCKIKLNKKLRDYVFHFILKIIASFFRFKKVDAESNLEISCSISSKINNDALHFLK